MTKEKIIAIVNDFLEKEFEVDPAVIVPDANLRTTLDLDSLDYVDLVVAIESNLGFKVVAEDFTNIHTFQNFYDYCYTKVGQKEVA